MGGILTVGTGRSLTARAVFWSLVQRWGSRALSMAVLLVLARHLSPSDFGVVAFAAVFINVLGVLRDLGLAQALVQRQELTDDHFSTAFWASVATGMALSVSLYCGASILDHFLDQGLLLDIITALGISLLINSLRTVPIAILRRELRFKQEAARTLIATVCAGAVAIPLALNGFGPWALVAQAICESLVSVVCLWLAVRWRPRMRFSRARLRELAGFSAAVTGRQMLGLAVRHSDDLIIGTVLGATALGYYTVAYRILRLLGELSISVVTVVALPALARIATDRERFARAYADGTKLIVAVSAPLFCGLASTAPVLVPLAFGSEWTRSAPLMTLLAIGGLALPIVSFNASVLLARGKARTALMLALSDAGISVACFMAAIPFGLTGFAVAFIVRSFVQVPISTLLLRDELAASRGLLRSACVILGAAVLMGLGVGLLTRQMSALRVDNGWALLISATVGASLYLASLYVAQPGVLRELQAWAGAATGRRTRLT